jgi:hypothetical protein
MCNLAFPPVLTGIIGVEQTSVNSFSGKRERIEGEGPYIARFWRAIQDSVFLLKPSR